MKTALVCGADGFIGGHLVRRLLDENYYVRAVGRKQRWEVPFLINLSGPHRSHVEYYPTDLRFESNCRWAVMVYNQPVDEVYQLAAEMGGMGYISSAECDIMRNSCLVNLNMIHISANAGVKAYFFSSSACVYPDQAMDEPELFEVHAYPANPDNEYGWEKLFSERVLQAYGRKFPMAIRIGRFQNTYGPDCAWRGGREKAPAAICRKVAEAPDGGAIEIWGDGSAMRAYTFINDTLDGIRTLMTADPAQFTPATYQDLSLPFNIGRREYVSVDELAKLVIEISGKDLSIFHVDGPVGVQNRGFRADRIESLGWQSKVSLKEGLTQLYTWIENQLRLPS